MWRWSGVKILDFKTSFYHHFGTPLTGYVLGDRSVRNISATIRGPTKLLPSVLLTSAKRLEDEDTLQCLIAMYVVSKLKMNLRNRAEGSFLFGRGSDKFTTCVYSYGELCWLGNTFPYTRGHCDILRRDVISQWGFRSLSVQKIDSTSAPGAYDWHINSLKRRLVFVCDWKQQTLLYTGIWRRVVWIFLTTLKMNALYSYEHTDICVPLYPTPCCRRSVSLPTSLWETRILQHFFHTSRL
jgi:hypothetical protein